MTRDTEPASRTGGERSVPSSANSGTSRPGEPRRKPHPQRWSGIERALRAEFGPLLAGVDEVGRGPLAGPVVACAVIMPPDQRAIAGVDDSKQLSPQERGDWRR